MRRWIKRAGKIALGILAALPIVLLVAFGLAQTEFGKRQILAIAERSLSDTPMKLQAQALEGFLPFRIRLVGVSLSDAQGPWLTADHLALDWSPAALLARRVAISELSADRIVLARPPLSTPRSSAPQPSTPSSGPRPPRLQVAIDLERLSVEKLELGPTILGEPASFTVAAQAHLGELSQSLQASFDVKRTDRDLDHAALAFDYSPDADRLKLDLSVEEPQGGLITHLMGLAGTPNLAAEIHGNGPLADWQASGKVALDEKPLLNLAARSTGAADARAVSFTARADPAEFVPPDLAPLLEGGVTAEGVVHVAGPRQPIAIERLNVAARAGMVAVTGRIDPAGPLDLTLDLAPAELSVYAAFLPPDLAWASASARLRLTGTTAQLGTALDFSAQDLALSGNRIGATALHATADLDADRLRAGNIDVVLNATGITPSDPSLARFTQDAVLKFVGSADASGAIVLDRLTLIAGGSVLQASGTASNWGTDAAQASGKLDTADLVPLAALAGLHGAGAASINFDLQKTQSDYAAKLDAETRALSTGIAIADRLLGPTPALHLAVRHSGTAATIDQATLQAAKLGVKASGSVGDDGALDLKADADLADLGTVMTGGSGALAATATVTGTIAAPSAKLLISSRRLTMSSIELANLAAAIDASDFATRPKARLKATAAFADLPASLDGDVAFTPASNEVKVTGLDARLGQSILVGTATVKGTLADGDLALKAPDIAELSVLARRNLAGNAEVKVTFLTDRNRQNAELHATAAGLAIAGTKIESAKLDATGTDVLSANATLGADAVLSSIAAGGQAVGRVEARASGALANLAVTLDAASPEARLAAAATVKHVSEETGIALAKLDLTAKGAAAHLQHTAEITLKGPRAQLTGLAIAFDGGGALTLDAALGPQGSTADAKLAALPLGLAHAFSPDLDLTGVLDGAFHLEGNRQAPAATLKLKGTGLAIKGASPSPVDLTLDAAWRGGVLDAKGRVALQKGGALDLAADLPVAADPTSGLPAISNAAPLRATAEGKLDLALLNAVIPGGADQVAGEASIDLSASGAVGAPVLAGKLTIANGAYENLRYGTRLRALAVTVEGNGTSLKITSLSAKTPDGGTIDGNGAVDFGGEQAVQITINMHKARMLDAPIGTAVSDGNLVIAGSLKQHIALTGKVKIVKAEIRIPDRLPADVAQIPVVEVNVPPARAAEIAKADAPLPKSAKIALDLAVDAPEEVFVRGRGLDAELGGKLEITGTADQPIIAGALSLRRGEFNLLSRRLDFSRGQIGFTGGTTIDPTLDFVATSKLPDADVTITVGGTATKPSIALTSSPALPQDEILARLLFGKATGALSPFEALQLAQAAAQLAGVDTGTSAIDKIRRTLGLDRLNVESGEGTSTAPTLSAGRYVSRGVFVGAKQGTAPGSTAATVEIEVTPNVKLQTDVGADAGKVGVNMEWDY